jgi:hypothetical protein
MKKKLIKLSIALIWIIITMLSCNGQNDSTIFKPMPSDTSFKSGTPGKEIGQRIITVATPFLGKPYIAKTLDKEIEEKMVIDTTGYDCYTLVETVLAKTIAPNNYENKILQLRYRDSIIKDYTSRIHYFTEWIYENKMKGIIKDVTPESKCARPYPVKVGYMSANPSKYKQLAEVPSFVDVIKKQEEKINQFSFQFIPKDQLHKCVNLIKSGDIIAITTNIKGLDISHSGFAVWKSGTLKLLHASSDLKKVVVTKESLTSYLLGNKKQTGVIVLRVVD